MAKVKVKGSVIFITGANRGIGLALAERALELGAARVYAGARNIKSLDKLVSKDPKRVVPVSLDVTQPEQITAAAKKASDVNIFINNAGVAVIESFLSPDDLKNAYHEMEVNYFALARTARAFAPVLKKNGGGCLVNNVSVAGLVSFPAFGSYSASKAAAHSLTQTLRAELAAQGTFVAGIYPGPIDTDMAKDVPVEKETSANVAAAVYRGLEAGTEDIFPDPYAKNFAASLKADAKAQEKQIALTLN